MTFYTDQYGNMPSEAPVTGPIIKDWNGNVWDERPDVVINKYLANIQSLIPSERESLQGMVTNRKWREINAFLSERLRIVKNADDRIRIEKVMKIAETTIQKGFTQ